MYFFCRKMKKQNNFCCDFIPFLLISNAQFSTVSQWRCTVSDSAAHECESRQTRFTSTFFLVFYARAHEPTVISENKKQSDGCRIDGSQLFWNARRTWRHARLRREVKWLDGTAGRGANARGQNTAPRWTPQFVRRFGFKGAAREI